MCLSKISDVDLINELKKRGLLTNSKSNNTLLSKSEHGLKVILTYGEPIQKLKCRECGCMKDSDNFSFYQSRVDGNGYLMRANALCCECSKKTNKQRKEVLDNAHIPDKPNKGDVCLNCKREWNGNWHRHHVGQEFVAYICGHCNMSFSDQRNKINLILQ
jgi:hypothetical protein